MATTTNFGWETPDDTDLVKDGAAAMRTLGNSIDTSFVDLKGGTTGQVLSKNSNTDLDFTWVAQDDSNAIQNSIVDAKADLITATAADTPARLAVGNNADFLVADSSTATGLAWKSAATQYAYTTWTPTFTNFTLGNGTATARYAEIGKLVHCELKVVLGSTSSVSGLIQFTLPKNASTTALNTYIGVFNAVCLDAGVTQYTSRCALISSTDAIIFALNSSGTYLVTGSSSATVPFTWGSGDEFYANFVYEVA